MLDQFDEGQIEINWVIEARAPVLKTVPEKTFAVVSISGESAGGDDIVSKIAIGTALKLTLGTGNSFGLASVQPAGRPPG